MRYFSTFTGIGGFELGIGQEHTCVGYSEIDKYAIQVYQRHFAEHINYGDITTINATELPDFDLFVGGFPCQAFSIAGKRKGFEDTRGTLFFEIARILRAKQPRLLFLENVKGLLSHDNGQTFATIIATLDELGYDVQWQVLNSKNHGVPQNRERVFIIGHSRGTPRPEVFPFIGSHREINVDSNRESEAVIHDQNIDGKTYSYAYSPPLRSANTIWNRAVEIKQLNQPKHSNDRVYGDKGLSPALNTMQGGNRQPKVYQNSGDIGNRKISESDIAYTIRAHPNSDGGQKLDDGARIRRLTPTECERLQGFPDGWTEGVSDTQRYKMCGNAVTVNVIKDICERLLR